VTGGESGGKSLTEQISFQVLLNEVIESPDCIESGMSCQTLGATTPKALPPVADLVQRCVVFVILRMNLTLNDIFKLSLLGDV